ncbi:MAG: HIT family protein [Deltaproteobacteria bacterium]|nr:MAG: HIT family protein [Deltaproteobacteria bacterium]
MSSTALPRVREVDVAPCVFCGILGGELEASIVLDEPEVLGFLDLHPWSTGHALLVPRRHAQHLDELTEAERASLIEAGNRVSRAMRDAGLADDVHFVINDGPRAAQTVPHAHLHVVPRSRHDRRRMLARLLTAMVPPLWKRSRDDLDRTAATLREALAQAPK